MHTWRSRQAAIARFLAIAAFEGPGVTYVVRFLRCYGYTCNQVNRPDGFDFRHNTRTIQLKPDVLPQNFVPKRH